MAIYVVEGFRSISAHPHVEKADPAFTIAHTKLIT